MLAGLSRHMTLLGFLCIALYGGLAGAGMVPVELAPQFLITAALFIFSGRAMRRHLAGMQDEEETPKPRTASAPDWPFLTALLNWFFAFLIIGAMAIGIMLPADFSFEVLLAPRPTSYSSGFIP